MINSSQDTENSTPDIEKLSRTSIICRGIYLLLILRSSDFRFPAIQTIGVL